MQDEYERRLIANEFSRIIQTHNGLIESIKEFRDAYPYLIAPNVFDILEGNIKENTQIMYRELQNLMRPDGPHYHKKYVCKNCHQVFMMSLPEGLCDECRSKLGSE
jgi:hypothetical protein